MLNIKKISFLKTNENKNTDAAGTPEIGYACGYARSQRGFWIQCLPRRPWVHPLHNQSLRGPTASAFFFFFSFVVHFVFRHFLFFLSSFSFPFVFPFVLCIGYFCSKISWLRNVLFISFRFFHVHINILLIWRNLREILKFLFFSFLFFFFINKFQIQIAWNVS